MAVVPLPAGGDWATPAVREALAGELQRLSVTRLADELLRWLGRSQAQLAGGKRLLEMACQAAMMLLRMAGGEAFSLSAADFGGNVPQPSGAGRRRDVRRRDVAPQPPQQEQAQVPAASRRTSRDLGAVLTSLKLGRLVLAWLREAEGDVQRETELLSLANGVAILAAHASRALGRPPHTACQANDSEKVRPAGQGLLSSKGWLLTVHGTRCMRRPVRSALAAHAKSRKQIVAAPA